MVLRQAGICSMSKKKILVVAAHADDEALGCGGTIAKHSTNGDEVFLILMADGVSSRNAESADDLQVRNIAAQQAAKILGIKKIINLGFPDNTMDSVPLLEIVKKLEVKIQEINPEIIYTHHYGDLNIDHRITNQAVLTACRPMPESSVKEIYTFEVMSSTEWSQSRIHPFLPNFYVDVTSTYALKAAALKSYKMEMREYPHSRSIKHLEDLARYRGGCVGLKFSEAFEVVRVIR